MDNTQSMKPQDQPSRGAASFLSLGLEEGGGELHDVKPVGISLFRDGEEEKGMQPEPEERAASAEGKEIGAEEEAKEGGNGGLGGSGASVTIKVENHKASGDSGQKPGEQGQEVLHPRPRNRQQVAQRATFSEVQLQELERIFQRNAHPDLVMR
ncbi:hypothetical protein HJG60_012196 [Phyllostomus discolor]|uniref:Uncharacterized protein n=1 Tax=Phyllostomus discolor TaxID=89673 RepID=A0A833Z660_9CHIR|nr:hypothetical protein HJG60_012196 [Phyllostomus discolor]